MITDSDADIYADSYDDDLSLASLAAIFRKRKRQLRKRKREVVREGTGYFDNSSFIYCRAQSAYVESHMKFRMPTLF